MNNLKDNWFQVNLDTLKIEDSVKSVKIIPLGPSKIINSEDGAIIPKEVLQAYKIVPSKPVIKEENSNLPFYFLIGFGVLTLILFFKFFKRKFKRKTS